MFFFTVEWEALSYVNVFPSQRGQSFIIEGRRK